MAKTKEELTKLKEECESLATKLNELNEDELKEVAGGLSIDSNKINLIGTMIGVIGSGVLLKTVINDDDSGMGVTEIIPGK